MLTVAQTAFWLNRGEHEIPLLVRAGLLKPLGHPPPNAVKFFATVDVLELAGDRDPCLLSSRGGESFDLLQSAIQSSDRLSLEFQTSSLSFSSRVKIGSDRRW